MVGNKLNKESWHTLHDNLVIVQKVSIIIYSLTFYARAPINMFSFEHVTELASCLEVVSLRRRLVKN